MKNKVCFPNPIKAMLKAQYQFRQLLVDQYRSKLGSAVTRARILEMPSNVCRHRNTRGGVGVSERIYSLPSPGWKSCWLDWSRNGAVWRIGKCGGLRSEKCGGCGSAEDWDVWRIGKCGRCGRASGEVVKIFGGFGGHFLPSEIPHWSVW